MDNNSIPPPLEPYDSSFEMRLLCSYGGQVERMHASALEYRGGENRLVTVDRRWSASELLNHLSDTFFGGLSLILKYHLPCSHFGSLVSVVTDEDLRHMIEEHDRLAFSAKPPCLRALLFSKDQEVSVKSLVHRDDKLRLMCKYGGRFYFRPRRDIQSYIGGHTRIIVMDRPSSLSNLYSQISLELLNGCKMTSFTLKYKKPEEAVDCLISLATDQDLHIMMELYNYLSSLPPKKNDYKFMSPLKQFHLHLFVFAAETQAALPLQDDRPLNQPGESIDWICNKNRDSNPSEEPVLRECPIEVVPDPNCKLGIQLGESSGNLSSSTRPPQQQQLDQHPSIAPANSGLPSSSTFTIIQERLPKTKKLRKHSAKLGFKSCSVKKEDSDSSSTDGTD